MQIVIINRKKLNLSPHDILSATELKRLENMDKTRIAEFTAGRHAVKTAIQKTLKDKVPFTNISIKSPDKTTNLQKPQVLIDSKIHPILQISITHTQKYASGGASLSKTPIGIDLEENKPAKLNLEKIGDEQELKTTGGSLINLWTIKEALFKAAQNPDLKALEIVIEKAVGEDTYQAFFSNDLFLVKSSCWYARAISFKDFVFAMAGRDLTELQEAAVNVTN